MQNVFAPVSVGEKIGTAQYYVGERLVATKDVLAKNSVDLEVNKTNFFEKFIIKCINLFRSI